MKCKHLFNELEFLREKYYTVWEDVCNLESPTANKAGVDAVGRYFLQLAKQHDWKTEVYPQDVAGDVVCITMNPDAQAQPIAFSAHLDTVQPVGSCGTPAVRRDTEKIYGPGVLDCKGGAVAAFMAMDALDRIGFRARPLMLLLQTDEEVGSKLSNLNTIRIICEKAKNAAAFINLEGFSDGKACLARKGIARYQFTVTGIEAHSSNCAKAGANAIAEAAHKILALEEMKEHSGLTCNCGLIQGGTAANTVPLQCTFSADIRFASQQEQTYAEKRVHEIAAQTHIDGCICTVELVSGRPAMELVQRNLSLLDTVNRIYAENDMPILHMVKNNGGSDASYVTDAGIPCIDSLGTEGGQLHSVHEFAWLQSLIDSAKRCAAIAYCL